MAGLEILDVNVQVAISENFVRYRTDQILPDDKSVSLAIRFMH